MNSERHIRFLNHNEASLLVNSIPDNRHKCLVLLMLDAGLRVSEAICLKFGNFDFKNKILNVKSLKKRDNSRDFNTRQIPLSQRLFFQLADYAREFEKLDADTFLFPSPKNPKTHICRFAVFNYLNRLSIKKVNIQNLHPHVLRHSFATGLVATGADLHKVADLLGHQSLDTSRIYTHIPQDQLAKSVNAAATRNGAKFNFLKSLRIFKFIFPTPIPAIYIPNQQTKPIIGRNQELTTISDHLSNGTNVLITGRNGTGKRLILESIKPDRKVLTFDDTTSIKKSLIYLLLYLYKNDKEQVAAVLFKDFDMDKIETRLSRQSIGFLCDEIKSIVQPKEYILKIMQFDDVTKQSLKVIEKLKDTFVILTAAVEIPIDKAPFFGNFERIEVKNLNRPQSFELIHKLSYDLKIDDYEQYRNHIWQQTNGNPKAITEMVERYRRVPRLVPEAVRSVTYAGAIKEWDCTYGLVILIGAMAVMRYMTSEFDNPGLRTIGGMAMILLLLTRAFAARTKQKTI